MQHQPIEHKQFLFSAFVAAETNLEVLDNKSRMGLSSCKLSPRDNDCCILLLRRPHPQAKNSDNIFSTVFNLVSFILSCTCLFFKCFRAITHLFLVFEFFVSDSSSSLHLP